MLHAPFLFLNVFLIAICGLVYELLAGTLASYVLGDSVTQFSVIIGVYLSAMGAGAWLSRFVDQRLARVFIEVEFGVALLGGLSAPLLFLSFAYLTWFRVVLYGVVFLIGVLVGLELPLLMRILQERLEFKELVSRVLAFDYIGALAASLLFPLFCVPRLGLVRTSLAFGIVNALVGLWGSWLLEERLVAESTGRGPHPGQDPAPPEAHLRPARARRRLAGLRGRGFLVVALLVAGLIKADALTSLAEDNLFNDPIVHAQQSAYQRIVVTSNKAGFQLFLNGNLQFSAADEYRYHEALVHPALLLAGTPRRVLVLGGGDGLAVREILKHASVEEVTLVDIDPAMTDLGANFPPLVELNAAALRDPRVHVVNDDAMLWLESPGEPFDAAIVDFPDPNTFALGKLYTRRFYQLLRRRLTETGTVGLQATSPLYAPRSYWCVLRTMESAGFHVRPYHVAVPSFAVGVWGFALAAARPFDPAELAAFRDEGGSAQPGSLGRLPGLRSINAAALQQMFLLPADLQPVDVEVNRLDNQILVRYYEAEWSKWY